MMSPTNFRGSKSASRDKTGATDQRGDVAEALSHSGVAASHSIAHVIPVVERFAARALLMIGCVFLRESAGCSRLDASSFEQVPVARDWTRLPTSKCQLLAIGRVFLRASVICSQIIAPNQNLSGLLVFVLSVSRINSTLSIRLGPDAYAPRGI